MNENKTGFDFILDFSQDINFFLTWSWLEQSLFHQSGRVFRTSFPNILHLYFLIFSNITSFFAVNTTILNVKKNTVIFSRCSENLDDQEGRQIVINLFASHFEWCYWMFFYRWQHSLTRDNSVTHFDRKIISYNFCTMLYLTWGTWKCFHYY